MSNVIQFESQDIRNYEIHWNIMIFDGLSPCQYSISIHEDTKMISANIMCDTFDKIQLIKEQLLKNLKLNNIRMNEGRIRKLWINTKQ